MRERKDGGKEGGFEQVEGGSRDGGEFGEQGQTDRWKSAKVKSIYRSACFLLVPLFISPLCFQHSHMSLLTFTMHSRWSWIFHPHTHTHTRSYFPPDLTHCSTLHNSHPPLQAHIYNEQTHANYLLNFVKIRGHCRQNNRMRTPCDGKMCHNNNKMFRSGQPVVSKCFSEMGTNCKLWLSPEWREHPGREEMLKLWVWFVGWYTH